MTLFRHRALGAFPADIWDIDVTSQGSVTEAAAQTAWHNTLTAVWGTLGKYWPASVTVGASETVTVTTAGKSQTKTSQVETLAGTGTGVLLPQQLCELISWETVNKYRGAGGRLYLPAMDVATVAANGVLLPAVIADLVTAKNQILSTLSGAGLTPGLLSRKFQTFTPILSGRVPDHFTTQRRRRNKVQVVYAS